MNQNNNQIDPKTPMQSLLEEREELQKPRRKRQPAVKTASWVDARGKTYHYRDWTGVRLGSLTILEEIPTSALSGKREWRCVCDCGNIETRKQNILSGAINHFPKCQKCLDSRLRIHGKSRDRIYQTWKSMKARCDNPKAQAYASYGGRGITYCPRWAKFENFAEDMGAQPEKKTLNRINNDGPYSPENCEWTDWKTQARNKRNTVYLTALGQKKPLTQWLEELGIGRGTVCGRIKRGLSHEQALGLDLN